MADAINAKKLGELRALWIDQITAWREAVSKAEQTKDVEELTDDSVRPSPAWKDIDSKYVAAQTLWSMYEDGRTRLTAKQTARSNFLTLLVLAVQGLVVVGQLYVGWRLIEPAQRQAASAERQAIAAERPPACTEGK